MNTRTDVLSPSALPFLILSYPYTEKVLVPSDIEFASICIPKPTEEGAEDEDSELGVSTTVQQQKQRKR